ncbi:MAG: glycosyl transferase [Rhodospirillales bacterium]|nr:glycosyl transferase [Rhodospirillales bacterium]
MAVRIFFYVQHLLGIGHLKRASVLANAMATAGFDVAVAVGGGDMPYIRFPGCSRVLLPPVRAADASFKVLLDADGAPIDAAFRDRRAHRLVSEFAALHPQILLIEQFPFGRRQFRFELMPLLEAARSRRPPPLIVCSLRDILVHKHDPERTREMLAIASRFFDRILVHGDPQLIPLDASFPYVAQLREKITYTGYVCEPAAADAGGGSEGRDEVIVMAGGGAVGAPLMRLALAARPQTSLADSVWRLITGPNLDAAAFAEFAGQRQSGVIVERWRSDVRALLRRARLAISQGGYNTIMDLLATGVPAVVVPFASETETEQRRRVRALAALRALTACEADGQSPNLLAAAIEQALTSPPAIVDVDLRGAETTAVLLSRWVTG